MIASLYTVDFAQGTQTQRLLSPGDLLLAEPDVKITQAADTFSPIGARWGESAAKGGAVTTMTWSVVRQHASHAAARAACLASAEGLPSGTSGTLKIAVTAGDPAIISGVVFLASATSLRVPCSGFQTVTVFTVQGGALSYVTATPLEPAVMPDAGQLLTRITERDVGNGLEKWMEFGFECEDAYGLSGNAATGWTDAGGLVRISLHRSANLLAWTDGEMTDCPGSPEPAEPGWHTYWARSVFPIDSAVKTGQLTARNSGDSRNNPIIAVTIEGVVQDLPHFPYDMASGTARAQLQADLRAAGHAGATVTATSVADWTIILPGVALSGYGVNSYAAWPPWTAYDPLSGAAMIFWAQWFGGEFVNSSGVRAGNPRQFCRLKLATL